MGRGKSLSEFEKGQIYAEQRSGEKAGTDRSTSKAVVDNFIKNPEVYGTRRSAECLRSCPTETSAVFRRKRQTPPSIAWKFDRL
ncbi:unnamed protein product [Haemonchus placei]|uniref:Transposase n=1 Tax=Haemonchus placei TaxID=6290 RepID=A0A0N4XAS1_HAEPC|nr:unnamed protein product [Haemonchus placei]